MSIYTPKPQHLCPDRQMNDDYQEPEPKTCEVEITFQMPIDSIDKDALISIGDLARKFGATDYVHEYRRIGE